MLVSWNIGSLLFIRLVGTLLALVDDHVSNINSPSLSSLLLSQHFFYALGYRTMDEANERTTIRVTKDNFLKTPMSIDKTK
jgi:hypothetical protein